MELSLQAFLIVCPLVFLGGFVDAVAGGGGLITVPAYMIAGLPAHFSIATNKLSASMGTTLSTFKLGRAGNIPWKKAVVCIIAAIFGGSLGAKLALMVSDDLFKKIMLVVIPLTALYIMRTKSMDRKEEADEAEEGSQIKYMVLAALIAFSIGVYDGFYGPGTGTFLILLLSGLAHFGLGEANGVSKAINLTTNLSSLVVYLMNGKVVILLGLVAGIFGILGNYIGVRLFMDKGAKAVKPLMITVMIIFFIRIISEMI
ncbi:MAG: TSUP family transporter [Mogibacterium sp.]|nr:TSUP family transporter [Mogibacterium sp.]